MTCWSWKRPLVRIDEMRMSCNAWNIDIVMNIWICMHYTCKYTCLLTCYCMNLLSLIACTHGENIHSYKKLFKRRYTLGELANANIYKWLLAQQTGLLCSRLYTILHYVCDCDHRGRAVSKRINIIIGYRILKRIIGVYVISFDMTQFKGI